MQYGTHTIKDKTLLAPALPGILPEMSIEESLDVTCIYSVQINFEQPPLSVTARFERRITLFLMQVLLAVEISPSPEKSPLPIATFYFSMSSPNSVPASSKSCANQGNRI